MMVFIYNREMANLVSVWAYGIACWEIYSFGAAPYAWMSTEEVFYEVPNGKRLPKPKNCSSSIYDVMMSCWMSRPELRPNFSDVSIQQFHFKRYPNTFNFIGNIFVDNQHNFRAEISLRSTPKGKH